MNETAPARIDFRKTPKHAQGLGAVWVGVYPEPSRLEDLRRLLGIPEATTPHSFSPLSRPDRACGRAGRFWPLRGRREAW